MKNDVFILLLLFGSFLTAVSQILLKASANRQHKKSIYRFLNWRVIVSYMIFFGVLLLNIYIYTGIDLKYGSIINASSYLFVIVLSALIFKDRISLNKIIGNLLILSGIIIYTIK